MSQDTQTVKFRLIGAAVVLIGLTLAWWLLLDHDVKRYQETRQAVPARIDIERFDIEEPQPVQQTTQLSKQLAKTKSSEPEPSSNEEARQQQADQTETVAKAKPETAAKPKSQTQKKPQEKAVQHDEKTGLAIAYVVQVGSFGKQENAEQLKRRLLEKKLPAYVKRFNLPQGTVYRVLIGPKLSQARAEEILPFIKLELNLDGQVLRYQPGFEE